VTDLAVEVRGLAKDFGPRRVLDVDRFAVETGSLTAVVGPNGSGKTTLLGILALLEPPTAGRIFLGGEEAGPSAAARRRLRRRAVMVHERPWMFHATVLENAAYGLEARGVGRREARHRAAEALDRVGLAHAASWPGPGLSAGEARRAALARALAVRPPLLLLDEPLADVDAQHRANIERIVRDLPSRGTTVLLTTHRLETAYRLADRCASLIAGRLRDALPDNHFSGTIVEADGEPVMALAPGCRLHLATPVRGPAHVVIDPRTVILSRTAPASSARNFLAGRIAALSAEGDRVRVTVDVGVPASPRGVPASPPASPRGVRGVPIVALITDRSLREMGLQLNEPIQVVFKTLSLDVYGGASP